MIWTFKAKFKPKIYKIFYNLEKYQMTVIGKRNSGVVQEPTIFEFYSPWSSGGRLRFCGTDIVQEENAMSEVQF